MLCLHRLDGAYRLAWAMLGDATDAQSVTHRALADAWRHRRMFADSEAFAVWLDRALVAAALDRLRRRQRDSRATSGHRSDPELEAAWAPLTSRERSDDELSPGWAELVGAAAATAPGTKPRTGRHAGDARTAVDVLQALEPLPRVIAVLRFWADLAPRDIASRIGQDPASVEARLELLTASLASTLGYEPPEAAARLRETLHHELIPPLAAPPELRHGIETREMLQPVRAGFGRRGQGVVATALSIFAAIVLVAVGFLTPHGQPAAASPDLPAAIDAFGRIDKLAGWATAGHALYVTRDGGRTWRKGTLPAPVATFGPRSGDADNARLYLVDPDNGWLVTGGTNVAVGSGQPPSVYWTHDGGKTWGSTALPADHLVAAFDFVDREHAWLVLAPYDWSMYAPDMTSDQNGVQPVVPQPVWTSMRRLLATEDGGKTWDDVATLDGLTAVKFLTPDEGWGFAATTDSSNARPGVAEYRIYRLTHGGRYETHAQLPAPSGCLVQNVPLPVFSGRTITLTLVCGIWDPSRQQQMMQLPMTVATVTSGDGGATWSVVAETPVDGSPTLMNPGDSYTYSMPRQPIVLMDGVWVTVRASFDGGTTWRTYSSMPIGGPFTSIEFASPDDVWAARTGSGDRQSLFASIDGGKTWRPLLGADGPLPMSTVPPTSTPEIILPAEPTPSAVPAQLGPQILFARLVTERVGYAVVRGYFDSRSDDPLALFMSQDGGATWHAPNKVPLGVTDFNAIDFVDEFRGWAVASPTQLGGGSSDGTASVTVYRTQNGGAEWTAQKVTLGGFKGELSASIHFRDGNEGVLLFQLFSPPSADGFVTPTCLEETTSDGGDTWSSLSVVDCFVAQFTDRLNGFGVTGPTDVVTTVDGGLTWVKGLLPQGWSRYFGIAAWKESDSIRHLVFVGDETSLVSAVSRDGGKTWAVLAATPFAGPMATGGFGADGEVRVVGQVNDGIGSHIQVMRSTDSGVHWQTTDVPSVPGAGPGATFAGGSIWVGVTLGCNDAGCEQALYRTSDMKQWLRVTLP